ncbi:hypothetical protein GCM10011409_19150 [Lentibacillus populi]|uniref:Uncharacterized protein n=1 Tax=Lentibacillus populi TaxID=1827502 RepID=A0A9W5TXC0_9BACI|nr:hypothetical protein [Lentibacillus populi]GGB41773.1 hypothetical protein GCM10011409_19150 [Lentibacillus populi]
MTKLHPELLKNIDKPLEDIAHDLSLLRVKSKMESGQISTIGEMFETYVDGVDTFKHYFDSVEGLKDFIKS